HRYSTISSCSTRADRYNPNITNDFTFTLSYHPLFIDAEYSKTDSDTDILLGPQCAFFVPMDSSLSTSGCWMISSHFNDEGQGIVTCSCSHLTVAVIKQTEI